MKDLDRLARVFFSPETVGAEPALAVVKKPRAGEADFQEQELAQTDCSKYHFQDSKVKSISCPNKFITFSTINI
jgi:hypothetical protein